MPTKRNKSPRQELLDSTANAEEYYDAVLKDRLANRNTYGIKMVDLVSYRVKKGWCIKCGNPNMDEIISPYYCKTCSIRELGEEVYMDRLWKLAESEEHFKELRIWKERGRAGEAKSIGEILKP